MTQTVHHWKHGWIPLDDVARAEKFDRTHTTRQRANMVASALLAKKQAAEPAVTSHLQGLAQETGGTLVGLSHRLKTHKSLADKLVSKSEQRGSTPEDEARRIGDALRYTMQFDAKDYTAGVKRTSDALRAKGYRLNTENNWPKGTVYKGINSEVTTPSGEVFELQFHTPESFAQKESQHGDYEIMRDPHKPAALRKSAYLRMAGNWNNIPVPPAVSSLEKVVDPKPVTF